MAITLYNQNLLASSAVVFPLNGSDGIVVLNTANLGANTGIAIDAAGTANFINILGTVHSATFGVSLDDTTSPLAGHRLIVAEGGTVWGAQQAGVQSLSGDSFIQNDGVIGGNLAAINYDEIGSNSDSRLINNGSLTGASGASIWPLPTGQGSSSKTIRGPRSAGQRRRRLSSGFGRCGQRWALGRRGAVLIADLQAGAKVTAADILIF